MYSFCEVNGSGLKSFRGGAALGVLLGTHLLAYSFYEVKGWPGDGAAPGVLYSEVKGRVTWAWGSSWCPQRYPSLAYSEVKGRVA